MAAALNGKPFVLFIMSVVLANSGFLAIEHAGMSAELAAVLRIGNFAFIAVFTAELLVKLWALGWWQYWVSYVFVRAPLPSTPHVGIPLLLPPAPPHVLLIHASQALRCRFLGFE